MTESCLTDNHFFGSGILGTCLIASPGSFLRNFGHLIISTFSARNFLYTALIVLIILPHISHLFSRSSSNRRSFRGVKLGIIFLMVSLARASTISAIVGMLSRLPAPCVCYVDADPWIANPKLFRPAGTGLPTLPLDVLTLSIIAIMVFHIASRPMGLFIWLGSIVAHISIGHANLIQCLLATAAAILIHFWTWRMPLWVLYPSIILEIVVGLSVYFVVIEEISPVAAHTVKVTLLQGYAWEVFSILLPFALFRRDIAKRFLKASPYSITSSNVRWVVHAISYVNLNNALQGAGTGLEDSRDGGSQQGKWVLGTKIVSDLLLNRVVFWVMVSILFISLALIGQMPTHADVVVM